MAMTDPVNAATSGHLPCGRSVEDVWDHLAQPVDAHETTCPYCQDARVKLGALQAATQDLRSQDAQDPELQPGPALKSSIMAVARTELRRSRLLPMIQPSSAEVTDPPLLISEFTICEQVRAAADSVPGIHARRCTATLDPVNNSEGSPTGLEASDLANVSTIDQPAKITITLSIAVSSRTDITSATTQLRQRIIDRLHGRTGLIVTAINIAVEDLYDA